MKKKTPTGLCRDNRGEWNSWNAMRHRCRNPKGTGYNRYGAVGIDVCDRWFDSFSDFLEDMGKKPSSKHSIDRIDNAKGYSPDNCRWATSSLQAANSRRGGRRGKRGPQPKYTFAGRTQNMTEWAREIGIKPHALAKRIHDYRWPLAQALGFEPRPKFRSSRNSYFTYNGETKHITEWAKNLDFSTTCLLYRIKQGWSIEKAMTTPSQRPKKGGNDND